MTIMWLYKRSGVLVNELQLLDKYKEIFFKTGKFDVIKFKREYAKLNK